ncbi:MAG: hypothetical protein WCJ30_15500 [Deltaproteobacteria bacterium]
MLLTTPANPLTLLAPWPLTRRFDTVTDIVTEIQRLAAAAVRRHRIITFTLL